MIVEGPLHGFNKRLMRVAQRGIFEDTHSTWEIATASALLQELCY